jgi:hypothetical protein
MILKLIFEFFKRHWMEKWPNQSYSTRRDLKLSSSNFVEDLRFWVWSLVAACACILREKCVICEGCGYSSLWASFGFFFLFLVRFVNSKNDLHWRFCVNMRPVQINIIHIGGSLQPTASGNIHYYWEYL